MDYKQEIQNLVEEIKKQGYENICFMHPALAIGGASLIEAKLADYLANNTDLNIYYYDYNDGYGEFLLKDNPKVKKIIYKDNDITFPLKEKCIFFTNSTRCVLIKRMHPESKILFWHYESVKCGWDSVLIDKETNNFLILSKKENAMVFLDWSSRDSLSRFSKVGFNNKDYIHIVLSPKEKMCLNTNISEREINICFLSRLAPDKIQSLFYLIRNFASYKTDKKKRLHIIGDGRSKAVAKNFCKKYENEIEFLFTGTIAREELDDYLINNVDIVFGVGTCILESAALKLPSIILFMDSKRFEDKDAIWLYDSKEYCVGLLNEEKRDFKVKYTSITNILDSIYLNNKKQNEGEKCYQYFINNHSNYDALIMNVLSYLKNTSLTIKKLNKCIKYIPYNRYNYKLWSFLGIPIIKKTEFLGKTKYFLFGFLEIFKKKLSNNKKKYYICGILFQKCFIRKGYNFPSSSFDNREQYLKIK